MIKRMACVAVATTAMVALCDTAATIMASVSLMDGSTVKGEFLTKQISGSAIFKKDLALAPTIVRNIAFNGTNGESKVELVNGDRFAMTVTNDAFAMRSLLGDLNVPRKNFRSISLFTSNAAVRGESAGGLVFHCTFDGHEGTMRPLVGTADIRILNASFEDGRKGKAMRVQRGLPAVEMKFPAHTFGNKGCIEFWARLIDGKTEFSTGGDPRFFTLYSLKDGTNGGQIGVFEYASNSGNGNKGLWGGLLAGMAATHSGCVHMMPYSDIFHGKPYEDWHHYAISWDTDGVRSPTDSLTLSNRVVLFIDGRKVSTVHRSGASDMMDEVFSSSTLMGIPMQETGPSYNNKASFLIDDIKVWNFAKCEFDIN